MLGTISKSCMILKIPENGLKMPRWFNIVNPMVMILFVLGADKSPEVTNREDGI